VQPDDADALKKLIFQRKQKHVGTGFVYLYGLIAFLLRGRLA
jgi:hypothetical protein